MDLLKVATALWARKRLLAAGLVTALVLVGLGAYKVRLNVGPGAKSDVPFVQIEPRSFTTYETVLNLVVDVPGFGLGRTDVVVENGAQLAPTYAYLAGSDSVIRAVERRTGPLRAEISSRPVEDSPVFQLVVDGDDARYIRRVASATADAFIAELVSYQTHNDVPEKKRIIVRTLGAPSRPVVLQSRKYEILGILFLAPLIAAAGLALLLENAAASVREGSAAVAQSGSVVQPAARRPGVVPSAPVRQDENAIVPAASVAEDARGAAPTVPTRGNEDIVRTAAAPKENGDALEPSPLMTGNGVPFASPAVLQPQLGDREDAVLNYRVRVPAAPESAQG
jgi:hypothetical protein